MKRSELLKKLTGAYEQREELDALISGYEKLLGFAPTRSSALEVESTDSEDTPVLRGDGNALRAIASIEASTTESTHTTAQRGNTTYEIDEEWIGPRPVGANGQKVNIDNNI